MSELLWRVGSSSEAKALLILRGLMYGLHRLRKNSSRELLFFYMGLGIDKKHAWIRRAADGDVQLCDFGTA
ncbi:MAG TPA: hypothetical protein VHX20_05775, partial [Terracidiphilus sp.]|nr:hypothetical protein [Terracidiphilus sp.]